MVADRNKCPKCGKGMLLFPSLRMKACVDCRETYSWELEKDQPRLIQHQR